jgi:hypothetical protein
MMHGARCIDRGKWLMSLPTRIVSLTYVFAQQFKETFSEQWDNCHAKKPVKYFELQIRSHGLLPPLIPGGSWIRHHSTIKLFNSLASYYRLIEAAAKVAPFPCAFNLPFHFIQWKLSCSH